MDAGQNKRAAIAAREAGHRRVRRLTVAVAALATAATGVIASVTAGTGTARSTVRRLLAASESVPARTTVPAVPEPTATVPVSGAAAASSSSAPSPPPAAPASVASSAGVPTSVTAVSGSS